MNILALDTTGSACTVALRRPGHSDLICSEDIGRGHAEKLAPMVEKLLTEADMPARSIDRIGVAVGPGSFAGTRVGVAFARGLALSSGARALGVSNLALMACEHVETRPLAVVHDAKRGDIVLQFFADEATGPAERLSVAEAMERLQALHPDGIALAGSGAGLMEACGPMVGLGGFDPGLLLDLTALAPASAMPPAPFYARPPDAKLPGGIDPT